MLAKNSSNPSLSWALRIQGEVHFAQGNYLAAMQHYIKSLIVSTQFFQRPWSPMQSITGMWPIHGKNNFVGFFIVNFLKVLEKKNWLVGMNFYNF